MIMRHVHRTLLVFATTFLFVFGIWTMEIGEMGMRYNKLPTNGWLVFDAFQTYHAGLYAIMMSFTALSLAFILDSGIKSKRAKP